MSQLQRQKKILSKLHKYGTVDIPKLSEELEVSSMTIRRDLKTLSQEGLLVLTRNGAILKQGALTEFPMRVKRTPSRSSEKTKAVVENYTNWNWPTLENLKIGFCEADLLSTYRIVESNNQEEVAKARGYEMITINSEGDPRQQLADIRYLIKEGCNVIIVVPIDADAIQPALDLCRDKKIPVIIKNRGCNGIPGVDYVTHIASDFIIEGRLCAEWAYKTCSEKGMEEIRVAEIQGIMGGTDARDRSGGFHQAAAEYGNFKFVAQKPANWSRNEATRVALDILHDTNGNVDVFFCHNDEMALGAQTAIEAYGLKINQDVYLLGIDGMYEALNAIHDGHMSCTVSCTPKTGDLIFDILESAIGGEIPDPFISVEDILIDATNYLEEKARIASFCLNFITEKSTICLDTGSTTYAIAEQLKEKNDLTILSHSLPILQLLADSSVQLISIPGIYHNSSNAFLGQLSCNFIKNYQYDILFLSAEGIDAECGLSVPDIEDAETKKALIGSAKKTIAVLDKNKIGLRFFSKIVALNKIDILVTNEGADPEIISQIREAGVDVYLT